MAKKINMSFNELHNYRVKDFIDIFNAYIGNGKKDKTPKVREATQEDIDRAMGRR